MGTRGDYVNFLDKLDLLMARDGLRKTNLSEMSGVPYTTIDAFYKKGFENVKMSTIKKLANALNVSLDYLLDDRITDPEHGKLQNIQLTGTELKLVRSYRELDDWGKGSVDSVLAREHARCIQAGVLIQRHHVDTVAAHADPDATTEEMDDALSKLLSAHPEFDD